MSRFSQNLTHQFIRDTLPESVDSLMPRPNVFTPEEIATISKAIAQACSRNSGGSGAEGVINVSGIPIKRRDVGAEILARTLAALTAIKEIIDPRETT